MCSTCCALGVVGIYSVQQVVFVTVVGNRPCGGIGGRGENYIKESFRQKLFGVVWSTSRWYFRHSSK
jgi:hypothetical protein